MKKIVFLTLLFVSFFSHKANATYINETGHFFCGFDSEEEFSKWTSFDVNNFCEGNNFWFWSYDQNAAFYAPGPNSDGDDWLISPAVKLEAGKTYAVKVKMNCDWNISLAFTMGKEATVEGQNITIQEMKNYGSDWYYLKFEVPNDIESGDYYFGMHNTSIAWDGSLNVESFEVIEDNDGSITFTVLDSKTNLPVEGVNVSLASETFEKYGRLTNEEGKCVMDYLTPGTYNLSLERDGYYTLDNITAEVTAKTAGEMTVSIEERLVANIKGIIVDDLQSPVANAEIKLEGKNTYTAISDEKGEFLLEEVRRDEPYTMTVSALHKYTYSSEIVPTEEEIDLGNIQLNTLIPTPSNVNADRVERGVFVSWMLPIKEKNFIVDNNVPMGSYEYESPFYVYVGNKFQEPMTVTQISWAVKNDYPTMDLYIFPIKKNGTCDVKPVWSKKGVPSKMYNSEDRTGWSVYDLEEPITVPYGCIVAIGHEGSVNPVADYMDTKASVAADGRDLENGAGFRECAVSSLFIRAKGLVIASEFSDAKAQSLICKSTSPKVNYSNNNSDITYTIYRLEDGKQNDPSSWVKLADNLTDFYFLDKEISSVPNHGYYLYAVKSIYDGGKESPVSFSEVIDHNVHCSFAVSVDTNTAINLCDGAVVKIKNTNDPEYVYEAVVENTVAVFDNVYKGLYTMDVKKRGFKTAHHKGIELFKEENRFDVNLELDPETPFNIRIEQDETSTDCKLSWNNVEYISEDFESMEDFAVNPENEVGWTFYDGDQLPTYGVIKCQDKPYPNMYAPMAFQVMNPYNTTPQITDLARPYSGDKMLISVAVDKEGMCNDDYMFSPELSFENDFVFSFMAASGFFAELGREEFMVGYTTDAASADNVVWITKEPVTVGAVWTKFTYIMPAEAKHVVLRCVSNQHMFFMVDDVIIGYDKPETFEMTTFNVILDGDDYLTTDKNECILEELDPGKHMVELQTVYPMIESYSYSDFKQIVFQVEERESAGIDSNNAEVVYAYNTTDGFIVPSSCVREMRLYTSNGELCMIASAGSSMNVASLHPGVYVIKVITDDGTKSSKIVIR